MFKKKGLLILMFVSTLFLVGCATSQMEEGQLGSSDAGGDVIKIGYIGPLTGNAASYGQDVKNGIELYFKQNPTIDGKTVEVIYEDGACNGQSAANATQKLINVDGVQIILGGQCSGETLAAAPIAEQNKVILLSALSSSPEVTTAGDYVFRNYPSDAKVSETLVADILENDYKKIAVLAEQTDYAQAFSKAITEQLKSRGEEGRLALQESYAVDNTDFRTLLAKVEGEGADVLVSLAQSPAINGFTVKQMKEVGLDIQVYGTDTIDGPDFFNTAKDAAEGVKQVVVAEDPSREGYAEFVAEIPAPEASPAFPAFGYDAAAIAAMAIEQVGYDATAIKDYFNNEMSLYQGVASDIDFDENGDNLVPASVKVAKDGKFILPESK